jgi:predicted nucleic acid-binding protein
MTRVLVDSSVWIHYFNGESMGTHSQTNLLSDLIDGNQVCTNDLILTELLPFIRHAGEKKLANLLLSIEKYAIQIDWERVMHAQEINLKHGINKVGIPDLILLQNVLDNHLSLFTLDKHFTLMKKYHPLRLYLAE